MRSRVCPAPYCWQTRENGEPPAQTNLIGRVVDDGDHIHQTIEAYVEKTALNSVRARGGGIHTATAEHHLARRDRLPLALNLHTHCAPATRNHQRRRTSEQTKQKLNYFGAHRRSGVGRRLTRDRARAGRTGLSRRRVSRRKIVTSTKQATKNVTETKTYRLNGGSDVVPLAGGDFRLRNTVIDEASTAIACAALPR